MPKSLVAPSNDSLASVSTAVPRTDPNPTPAPEDALQRAKDISTHIEQEFGLSKLGGETGQGPLGFHIGLAPSYGTLTSESLKTMDEKLQVAMASILRTLAARDVKSMPWNDVMAIMRQDATIECMNNAVKRHEILSKPPKRYFFRSQSITDADVLDEIHAWFCKLVQDVEVLNVTKIDTKVLANIVARTDVSIKLLKASTHTKTGRNEESLLDIGFLRFPSITNPLFRLYHIEIKAWVQRKQSLSFIKEDSSGVKGEFYSCDFRPCKEIIDAISPEVREKALRQVEALFRS
ncbi:uncharacterized protein PHACADRAFT_252605 [Phanerochaete carnosa HHB-10118-sp]|uniref:Uncharacterized protein n=1 Tax=Phanerochaete carnosa (strain HHB-10118-sp) TaxID=650164 RepID=K5WGD1_PHACS|nr:uncharacterized protein PHACADRAFT_252605 [Phanerochaete carnosa HHB-10118-sp]EKM58350.1 hypothetical protein PHACADRAFT_252605 [Phanerochaete carnosa HHB-10118-sp]